MRRLWRLLEIYPPSALLLPAILAPVIVIAPLHWVLIFTAGVTVGVLVRMLDRYGV